MIQIGQVGHYVVAEPSILEKVAKGLDVLDLHLPTLPPIAIVRLNGVDYIPAPTREREISADKA